MLNDAFNVTNYFRTINFRIVTDFSLMSSNSLAIPDYWLKIDEFFFTQPNFFRQQKLNGSEARNSENF